MYAYNTNGGFVTLHDIHLQNILERFHSKTKQEMISMPLAFVLQSVNTSIHSETGFESHSKNVYLLHKRNIAVVSYLINTLFYVEV